MKLVSDTGPIIGLAKINRIYLLKNLAEEVIIPPMVYKELFGKTGAESTQIENALHDFIRIKNELPLDKTTAMILADLDEGEKQAIALSSVSEGNVLLLIDDRAGRAAADKLNVPSTGLIGILLLSKEKGLIEKVVPLIENLRHNGYWLSDEVMEIAKNLAGE